jgi:1-acyl-sn-glycerol-3-phosphate acyltransferase
MGDAEVIPIGTRGRPGRGTGKQRPSEAARGLAPSTARRTPPVPKPAPAEPPPEARVTSLLGGAEEAQRAPATTAERSVLGGIPINDWMAAFRYAAVEVFGDDWEPRLAQFLAFLRRRVTGDYSVDEYGFDPDLTERFFMAALRPIAQKWFRIDVRGGENIPTSGGALVVSNHSGTVPIDGLMTMVAIHDATGRFLRPLGADLVFKLPFVSGMARKGGATLACNEDAERMLSGGELVGVWPEGFKGIGKPYADRYKLQRFGRGGFVSAALRTGVPIIPLSVVGAEEIYPLIGNVPALARLLGVPYLPITPFFPLLGPLGMVPLPSKWLIEFGEPIRTDELDAGAADDPMLVFNVTDQVRETIQQTLYSLLMQRKSIFG